MSTHPTEQSPIKKFFDHIKNFLVYENQQGQNDEAFRNIDRCVSDHSESLTNYWYSLIQFFVSLVTLKFIS